MADSSALRRRLQTRYRTMAERAQGTTLATTRDAAPVKSGATKASITMGAVRQIGMWRFQTEIVAPTPQALFSDVGTKPHEIQGNPLLSFYWPKVGRVVVLRHVNHPGNRARHWFGKPMALRWRSALQRAGETVR